MLALFEANIKMPFLHFREIKVIFANVKVESLTFQ